MLKVNFKKVLVVIFLGLMASSCDEESSSTLAPEGHTDADGLVLESNGVEVYREFEGAIVTNTLSLTVGDTLELSVHFLDHDGNEIEHSDDDDHDDHGHDDDHDDDHGDEHGSIDGLLVTENDTSIVVIEVEGHEEEEEGEEDHDDHEEHGPGIHMIAVAAGSTSFKVQLMHEGHADYTSMSITVTVGASTSRDLSSVNKYFN
jgi:hypothetical protein|tara:strand:+ start:113 stop:721 length:609 start_codon:yes stop_codon:yes gene_type:complete